MENIATGAIILDIDSHHTWRKVDDTEDIYIQSHLALRIDIR